MTSDLISAIDAWKKAVAQAEAAEKFLDHTWRYHLEGRGPAATGGLVQEVAQFRARAQARLAAAMTLMLPITLSPMHREIATARRDSAHR